jgi:hypothetical protein
MFCGTGGRTGNVFILVWQTAVNSSGMPGPETNFLFPRGISYMGSSQGAGRIQLKSGRGIPELNQKSEPRAGY